jgi:hypothetical protein
MAGIADKEFKTLELVDGKISKLLTDTKGQASPTYDAAVDLPGMLSIKVKPKMDTKLLKGDSELLDQYSKVTEVTLDVECAMFSLDALAILCGGAVTATAETTTGAKDSKIKYAFKSKSKPQFFKMEGKWTYVNDEITGSGGDAHVIVYKCKVSDPPEFELNDASGDFGKCKFTCTAVACRAGSDTTNGTDWYDIQFNETAVTIGA